MEKNIFVVKIVKEVISFHLKDNLNISPKYVPYANFKSQKYKKTMVKLIQYVLIVILTLLMINLQKKCLVLHAKSVVVNLVLLIVYKHHFMIVNYVKIRWQHDKPKNKPFLLDAANSLPVDNQYFFQISSKKSKWGTKNVKNVKITE